MKRLFHVVIGLLVSITVNSQDSIEFKNFGWLEMMNQNEDFVTIKATADDFFADTSRRNSENNYKMYKRWESFWSPRLGTDSLDKQNGKSGMFYHHAKSLTSKFNQELCINNHESSNWESWAFNVHPPHSGNSRLLYGGMGVMWTVRIDTTDPNLQTMYGGSPIGGIWKTLDQGRSWNNISDQTRLPSLCVSDIKIDPTDNQHLLVSTGVEWAGGLAGIGVIQSFDGGASWDTTGLRNFPDATSNNNIRVKEVHFHPTDTNKYFALANNEVRISVNQGVTWDSVICTAPSGLIFENLRFHPFNPDTIYLSTRGTSSKLYRTFNGGATWQDLTSNLDTFKYAFLTIATTPANPELVLVAGNYGQRGLIHKSINSGNAFQKIYNQASAAPGLLSPNKSVFSISPIDSNIVIIGGTLIAFSQNGGSNIYSPLSRGNMHDDMRGIDFVNGLVAVATDGGISISIDQGLTWTNRYNGLNIQQPFGHDINEDFTYLISGMQDIGQYKFNISSKTWKHYPHKMDGGLPIISIKNDSFAIMSAFHGGGGSGDNRLFKSSNKGVSIHSLPVTNRPSYLEKHLPSRPKSVDKFGNFYMGYEDLYSSNDNGDTWTSISDFEGDFGKNAPANPNKDAIVSVAVFQENPNIIAIGFEEPTWDLTDDRLPCGVNNCPEKKFFITFNGGTTWYDRTKGQGTINGKLNVENSPITDIIFSPTDPSKIWVTLGGYSITNGNKNKVFYSPDSAKTWQNISYDLPNFPAHSIVYQPHSNDRLYLATDVGVYTKEGNETTWTCYNNNLPATYCVDLDLNNCGGALTVSGHGRGIWKSPLAPIVIDTTVTWSTKKVIGSDIIVEGILRIYDTLMMAPGTKIIIKEGAIVNHRGVIMASGCGENFWQGIELWGDSSLSQAGLTNQPVLSIFDDAKIMDAEVGIRTGKTDKNGNYVSGTSGGVIQAFQATLENNKVDLIMHPYQNFHAAYPSLLFKEKSYFRNSHFLSTDTLIDGTFSDVHVELNGIDGIFFSGVTFENQLNQTNLTDRGTAMKVINSSFVMQDYQDENIDSNKIEGFFMGIESYTSNPLYFPYITKTEFDNNVKSILVSGSQSPAIFRNNFNVNDFSSSYEPFGVYLNYSTGYFITENNFVHQGTNTANNAVGIVINGSQDYANELYRNNFERLHTATLIHGDNKKDSTDNGLEILCNQYEADAFHIALQELDVAPFGPNIVAEIANYQGDIGGLTNDPPAGNRFGTIYSCVNEKDIAADYSSSAFNYYHHSDSITTPYCLDSIKVTAINVVQSYVDTLACPSAISDLGEGQEPSSDRFSNINIIRNRYSGQKSEVSLNHEEEMHLHHFVRKELMKDTIGFDTVIQVMNDIGGENQLILMIAAMARQGTTDFGGKAFEKRLGSKSKSYLQLQHDFKNGSGKVFEAAKTDAHHPFFIWARTAEHRKNGGVVPANYQLPEKRIEFFESNQQKAALSIYPNPANEQLILNYKGEGNIQVQLFDIKGSLIRSLSFTGKQYLHEMNVAELQNGMYIIHLLQNGEVVGTEKISIQH